MNLLIQAPAVGIHELPGDTRALSGKALVANRNPKELGSGFQSRAHQNRSFGLLQIQLTLNATARTVQRREAHFA